MSELRNLPYPPHPPAGGEYPKQKTEKLADGRIVPLRYQNHRVHGNNYVIFQNRFEERDFDNTGVVPQTTHTQAIQPRVNYLHGAWHRDGVGHSPGNQ